MMHTYTAAISPTPVISPLVIGSYTNVPANKEQWQFTVINFECQMPEIENSMYGVQ